MYNIFNYIEKRSPIHDLTGATKLLCLLLWSLAAMTTYDTRLLAGLSVFALVLFPVSKIKVKDGEGNEAIYCLNRPHTGIYLPTMVWKEMYDFSEDSVLFVFASTHYNPDEYIRDYDEYVKEIEQTVNEQ